MTGVVIIGAGGHGREVYGAMLDSGAAEVVGFLDDREPDAGVLRRIGARWLGPVARLAELPPATQYLIGIGSGAVREEIDTRATELGIVPWTLVHPSAVVGRDVRVGPGVIIFAHATVTTNVSLGRHTHIGAGVVVGHDSTLVDYVSVYPNASISGSAILQARVTIGTTASVRQGLTVGRDATVGSGAAVVRDIKEGAVVVGVPARPIKPPS